MTASTDRCRPEDAAVLFVDLQTALVENSVTNAPRTIAGSAAALAEVAGILSMPVLFSAVPEGGGAPRHLPPLDAYVEAGNCFVRNSDSPFLDGALSAVLGGLGRRTLIVAGFATEAVVLRATLDALAAGYAVHVPLDACGGFSDRTEGAACRWIERAGGVTTSVVGLITSLAPDFSRPPGSVTFGVMREMLAAPRVTHPKRYDGEGHE